MSLSLNCFIRKTCSSLFLGVLTFSSAAIAGPSTETGLNEVVVRGEVPVGAYDQPAWASRARTTPITQGYVLSPYQVYTSIIWEGIAPRHGRGFDTFTGEIEIGLPHRFQIAFEDTIGQFGNDWQNNTTSVELRYSLADWNKIPLNPTLFAEWKFGTGRELNGDAEEGGVPPQTPDAYELRLLLTEEFCKDIQWSLNGFFEHEVGLDRESEYGFSQSFVYAPAKCMFQPGIEMQFTATNDKDTRNEHEKRFVLGPTLGIQFTPRARLDLAPLFGIGHKSPAVDAFVVFSYMFGGCSSTEKEVHVPVSMQNR